MSGNIVQQGKSVNQASLNLTRPADAGELSAAARLADLPVRPANGARPFPIPETAWVRVTGAGYEVEIAIAEITPDMATDLLRRMVNNRGLIKSNIVQIARDIVKGAWAFTGEPLIFDEFGSMLDGQHRCWGGVASKKPFVALLVRGVSRASFDRLDAGTKRKRGNVLAASGVEHSDLVAAAIALLLNKRNGGPWYECPANLYTSHDIGQAAYLFPGLEAFAPIAKDLTKVFGNKAAFWLAARYLTAQKDSEKSRLFFARLATGINLTDKQEPEYLLRSKLLELHGHPGRVRLKYPELATFVVNAWNNSKKGTKIKVLRGIQGKAGVPSFI